MREENSHDYLSAFEMGRKSAETVSNFIRGFVPTTIYERTVKLRFQKFRRVIKSIKVGRNTAIYNHKFKLVFKGFACSIIRGLAVESVNTA